MGHTVKVITVIGSSPDSFAKAADEAVRTAQKTIRNITRRWRFLLVPAASAQTQSRPSGRYR